MSRAVLAQRGDLHVAQIPGFKEVGDFLFCPSDIGLRHSGRVAAELQRCDSRTGRGDERVNVSTDFGLIVPVGMVVLVDGRAFLKDVLEMAFPSMAALVGSKSVGHGLVRGFLHIHVEGGVNLEASFVNLVGAVFRFEVATDFFDEVGRKRVGIMCQTEDDRSLTGISRLCGCDLAVLEHGVDHKIAALLCTIQMIDGRVQRWPFRQSCEQGGLFKRQLLSRLAEVKLRSGFETVHSMSEKNLVRIEREDLRLSETPLDLDGEHGFLHLALPAAIRREEEIAGKLNGQCGCALYLSGRFDVAIRGADDPPEVDAGVFVEILVFNGDESVPQDGRKIFVAGHHAALQGERSDDAVVVVVEFCDRTGTVGFESIDLRKIGGVNEEKPRRRAYENRDQEKKTEENAADETTASDFDLGKIFVENLHVRMRSG